MEEARLMEGMEASDSAKPGVGAMLEAKKLEIEGVESVPYRQASRATYAGGQCPTGGAWEAAVHFLTQVSTYPNLITPFILASIGWTPGIAAVISVFSIKVYCSYLMAGINVIDGIRYNRYRDLAEMVLGYPGYVSLVILDVLLVLGSMIGGILSGGILLKTLVLLYVPDTNLTLAGFILIVGGAVLLMSLIPTLHHLRWVNAFGVSMVLLYCVITGGLCIDAAVEDGGARDYSVVWGSPASRVFQVLNAVVLLGSVPVSPMLPEAQATLEEPVRDMRRGLTLSWPLVMLEVTIVAIPGYYAFGNAAGDPNRTYILQLLMSHRGAVATALVFVVLNICVMSNLFGQPLYELLEHFVTDPRRSPPRIFIARALCRGAFVCLFAFIAALIPFFSSIQGLFSSLTFVPMDVIIPLVLYQHVRQPGGFWKVFHYSMVVVVSLFCVGGAISSLRGIIVSASNFKVFANL